MTVLTQRLHACLSELSTYLIVMGRLYAPYLFMSPSHNTEWVQNDLRRINQLFKLVLSHKIPGFVVLIAGTDHSDRL